MQLQIIRTADQVKLTNADLKQFIIEGIRNKLKREVASIKFHATHTASRVFGEDSSVGTVYATITLTDPGTIPGDDMPPLET